MAAASGNWPWLTLRLSGSSTDESSLNQWSWKNFQASGANGMVLYFAWSNAPDTPTQYGTRDTFNAQTGQLSSYDCQADNSATPDYVDVQAPTWQAKIRDPEGSGGPNIDGEFNWVNVTTGSSQGTIADTGLSPGSTFTKSRTGTAGDEYKWQAFGATESGTDGNPDSSLDQYPILDGIATFPWCYFTIDTGNPEAPVITTNWNASDPPGTEAQFTFTEPSTYTTAYTSGPLAGQNDVVGYLYGLNNSDPSIYVPASSMGGSATVDITDYTEADLTVYVQAVGASGNPSTYGGDSGFAGISEYTIEPAPVNLAPVGWWRLNGNGQVDSSMENPSEDLALLGNAGFGCNGTANPPGYTCSLSLSGSADHAATQAVVGNNGSFSVSAWVSPAGCEQTYCAVLSQGAGSVSAFTMGYQASGSAGSSASSPVDCPCWLFSMPKSDTAGDEYTPSDAGSGWYVAAVPASSATNNWTQLTGVFYAEHGQLQLYVNGGDVGTLGGSAGDGNPAATASASPWGQPGTGSFRIGADWTNAGGVADYFDGSISDVCAFYGPLSQANVQTLYSGDQNTTDGCSAVIKPS